MVVSYIPSFSREVKPILENTPDNDSLAHIFSFLGKETLGSTIPRTCKRFKELANREHLWKALYEKEVSHDLLKNKSIDSWKEALKLRTLWMKGMCQKIDLSFMKELNSNQMPDWHGLDIKNGKMVLQKNLRQSSKFEEWDLGQKKKEQLWEVNDPDFFYTSFRPIFKDENTLVYPVQYQEKNETDLDYLPGLKIVKNGLEPQLIPLKNSMSELFFIGRYAIACSIKHNEIHIIDIDTCQSVDLSFDYEGIFVQQDNLWIQQEKNKWTVYNIHTGKQKQIQLPYTDIENGYMKGTVIGDMLITMYGNELTGYHIKEQDVKQIWQQKLPEDGMQFIQPSSGSFFGISYHEPLYGKHSVVLHDSFTGKECFKLSQTSTYGVNQVKIDEDSIYLLQNFQLIVYKMKVETSSSKEASIFDYYKPFIKNAQKIVSWWLTSNSKIPVIDPLSKSLFTQLM